MIQEMRNSNSKGLLKQVRKIKNRIHRQLENAQGAYVILMQMREIGTLHPPSYCLTYAEL